MSLGNLHTKGYIMINGIFIPEVVESISERISRADSSKQTYDLQSPFFYQDGSLDVQERTASHFLLHHTQYDAGLWGFVIHYWVTIGVYNNRIAAMIDRLLATADVKH
jgi:hypothetical protein